MLCCAHIALLLLIGIAEVLACPSTCTCKWKNGKQTVECVEKGALAIPDGIDPGTQVLDFSGNQLEALPNEIFFKLELINLQRIYLSRCQLRVIENHAFRGLTNLVELDLSENQLEVVPSAAFADCTSLMRLTLNGNRIREIRHAAFVKLSYLNTLELTGCDISDVDDNAFQGLYSLEWLRMGGNNMKKLDAKLPQTLKGVEFQGNNWNCDCHLTTLRAFVEQFAIPHTNAPICASPEKYAGRQVKSIAVEDFACLPDVTPTALYLEIAEGKNLSLVCNVHAVPEAHVSWWYRGELLQNDSVISPGLRLLFYVEEGNVDKRSELHIYNTGVEDNGTFICNAENSAGSVTSNYTIRVVLKEEPIVVIVAFPFEYILAAVTGAVALFLTFVICIIVFIIKCKRHSSHKIDKPEMQETLPTPVVKTATTAAATATTTAADDCIESESMPEPIIASNITPFYGIPGTSQLDPNLYYHHFQHSTEQNPDLINDTNRRDEADGGSPSLLPPPNEHQPPPQQSQQYQQQQQQPHCVILPFYAGSDGYPPDYGLPKLAPENNFYRTLPYNRAAKRQSAANPIIRYSREAEFLCRTSSFEQHYGNDIRYTADGYPVRPLQLPGPTAMSTIGAAGGIQLVTLIPSPPEGYKNETCPTIAGPSTTPATTTTPVWPACVPANLHPIQRRCVGAQTENNNCKTGDGKGDRNGERDNDVLTESPDEGYEGEPRGIVL